MSPCMHDCAQIYHIHTRFHEFWFSSFVYKSLFLPLSFLVLLISSLETRLCESLGTYPRMARLQDKIGLEHFWMYHHAVSVSSAPLLVFDNDQKKLSAFEIEIMQITKNQFDRPSLNRLFCKM